MVYMPKGQEIPQTSNNYLKFEDGDNKVRILDEAITGYKFQTVDDVWHKTREMPKIEIGKVKEDMFGGKIKFFSACPVWSYRDEEIKLMELTQISIMRAIEGYDQDPEWGDVQGYDLNIVRGKDGGKTAYAVKPSPNKSKISADILEKYNDKKEELKINFDEGEVPLPEEPAVVDNEDEDDDLLPF